MRQIHVPTDCGTADRSPAATLDKPPQITATDDIVTEHRWCTTSSDMQTTLAWLRRHGLAHRRPSGTGTSGGPGGVTMSYLMFDARPPAGIDSATVLLSVAPEANGGSAIRADVQVVWLPARSPAEAIPHDVTRIAVSAFTAKDGRIGHRVLIGADARKLAKIVNALPTAARAEHSCAMDQGYRLHVVAGSLVFDDDVACFEVTVRDNGNALPTLASSGTFIHAVASAMGLPDYPPR